MLHFKKANDSPMDTIDKRQLHHVWTKIRGMKPWYFLVVAVVSGIICVFALRANNLHMVALREAVYTADKNNGDVETALFNLRKYVYTHMNTNLDSGPNAVHPPIQLQYTYQRLEQAEADKANVGNTQLYTDAQHFCEKQDSVDFSGHNRVPCIENYVLQHNAKPLTAIPKNVYQFDFVSPTWSPDLAGWSLLITILFVLLFIGTWLFQNVIRHLLRRRA